jgi:hypothetical protein
MINKNTPKSAIYWRKRWFHLKMFALRNSLVRYSLYISRLINNQAPSYWSEWSAFIMNNYKRLEKLLSPFHKIWFHSIKGAALRRRRQKCLTGQQGILKKHRTWTIYYIIDHQLTFKAFIPHIELKCQQRNYFHHRLVPLYVTRWIIHVLSIETIYK